MRTLIRIVALPVSLVVVSPLVWSILGLFPALLSVSLSLLAVFYLLLQSRGGDVRRCELCYHLPDDAAQQDPNRLGRVLQFPADRTGHLLLEASATGLVLGYWRPTTIRSKPSCHEHLQR